MSKIDKIKKKMNEKNNKTYKVDLKLVVNLNHPGVQKIETNNKNRYLFKLNICDFIHNLFQYYSFLIPSSKIIPKIY